MAFGPSYACRYLHLDCCWLGQLPCRNTTWSCFCTRRTSGSWRMQHWLMANSWADGTVSCVILMPIWLNPDFIPHLCMKVSFKTSSTLQTSSILTSYIGLPKIYLEIIFAMPAWCWFLLTKTALSLGSSCSAPRQKYNPCSARPNSSDAWAPRNQAFKFDESKRTWVRSKKAEKLVSKCFECFAHRFLWLWFLLNL